MIKPRYYYPIPLAEQEVKRHPKTYRYTILFSITLERVHEIKLPTLALCGSEDIMTPPKYTKYLASKIEGARAVIIEGGTHMVFAEQPEVVNQAIQGLLDSL